MSFTSAASVSSVGFFGATKFRMSWYVEAPHAVRKRARILSAYVGHIVRQEVEIKALAVRRPGLLAGIELSHCAMVRRHCSLSSSPIVTTCGRGIAGLSETCYSR